MMRAGVRAMLALATTTGLVLGVSETAAPTADETSEAFFVNADGSVEGEEIESPEVTWLGEAPEATTEAFACPEVNDRPVYKTKSKVQFIPDREDPMSTWLGPGQSVTWEMDSEHTFTADVTVGAEAEAGVVVAKAKTSLSIKVGYQYKSRKGRKVSDTNDTKKDYRAVLGNKGYKITAKKTWYVPPCEMKSTDIVVLAPREGDLSIGRYKS
jgi:hypothetical protein